jgi:hypothetical protein
MHEEYQLQKEIMSRVYMAYTLRRLTQPMVLKLGALGAFVFLSTIFISVRNIAANAPAVSNPGEFSSFIYSAFMNTEVGIKVIFVGGMVTALLVARDVTRGVTKFTFQQFSYLRQS